MAATAEPRHRLASRVTPPWVAWLAVLSVVLLACSASPATTTAADALVGGYRRTPAPVVGDLVFIDYSNTPEGEVFHPVAEDDQLLLLFFGYLSCPDICPLTLADIRRALDLAGPEIARRVSVAMVSIDPERDSGTEIKTYLDVFTERNHALLAPDPESLLAAGDRFSAVWEIEDHAPGEPYFVSHSASIYVVDSTGTITWEFPFGTAPEAIASDLTNLAEGGA